MEIFIYKFIDPLTNDVRYIGKTGNLKNRFSAHLSKAKTAKTRLARWILSLAKQNLNPIMEIVEVCTEDNWEKQEMFWINYYNNPKLCNVHKGGKLNFDNYIARKPGKKYDISKTKKYRVRCSYMNTVYQVGEYKTEQEAIKAYDNFYTDPGTWILNHPRVPNNQNHNKKVYVYSKTLEYLTSFESVSQCAKHYNIDPSSIGHCCRGRLKTFKGKIFKYEPVQEE